jgi:uncharacterized protein
MNIPRFLTGQMIEKINSSKKVLVLYGARQTGKTTLVNEIIIQLDKKTIMVNADQLKYHDILSSRDSMKMKSIVSGFDLIVIDEAQRIPEIGINLKILHDEIPGLNILVTGSSSLDLSSQISEPLT